MFREVCTCAPILDVRILPICVGIIRVNEESFCTMRHRMSRMEYIYG